MTDPSTEFSHYPELIAAIRRGEARKLKIAAQPEMLTTEQVIEKLGISLETLLARLRGFELLGMRVNAELTIFPDWQFRDGFPTGALAHIARHFSDDPWSVYRFLIQPLIHLGMIEPLDMLFAAGEEEVVRIAEAIEQCGYL